MLNDSNTSAEPTINRDLAAAYILFQRGMRSCFYLDFRNLWDLDIDKALPFAIEYGRALLFSRTHDIRHTPVPFDKLRERLYQDLRDVLADVRRRCNPNKYQLPGFRDLELSNRVAPALEAQIEDWLLESLGAPTSPHRVNPGGPDQASNGPSQSPTPSAGRDACSPRSDGLQTGVPCMNKLPPALISIPESQRSSLEAKLRYINARKIEQREYSREAALRDSYDAVAQALGDGQQALTEEVLISRIPTILYEVSLELSWFTREEAEQDSFFWAKPFNYRNPPPIPAPQASLGIHTVQEAFKNWFLARLEGRMEHWRAFALMQDGGDRPAQSAAAVLDVNPPSAKPTPRNARRNAKYLAIDEQLRAIAASKPKSHEEVFQALNGRVTWPNAEPFKSARGWSAGFERDADRARSWLSKAWARLGLPSFSRGPK